jgi:signal peptidase I
MKHCIVNFSDYKFKAGQDRLAKSLKDFNYQGDVILFNYFEQVGSKPHLEVPYQFKVYAIEKARQMGYDVVLYCDASLYAIKDVIPVIYYIIEKGYLLEYCGFKAGQYSTDLCLNEFGLTRDDAMNIKLHSAGFTGLNFKNEKATQFFDRWLKLAKEEITFCGDWNNQRKQCSNDERCLGHRHDQTTASIIAHQLEMERINPHFMQYEYIGVETKENTIFNCRGIC